MFDILDFIDSEEIREFNRNTVFAPMEQAILIGQSLNTSVEQKISAWKMLVEQYSEEEFQNAQVGYMTGSDVSFKEVVKREINRQEKALCCQKVSEGVVFGARLQEEEFPRDSSENRFFSTYEKAYDYLKKQKQEYLDDEDLRNVKTKGVINVEWLDQEEDYNSVAFYFDDQLIMTQIYTDFTGGENELDMSFYGCYVPLPFTKGDILKSMEFRFDGSRVYGVLSHEVNSETTMDFLRRFGDSSDMCVTLDTIWKEDGKYKLGHEHLNFLHVERCTEDELPEDEEILKKISEMRRNNIEPKDFTEMEHISAK